MLTSLASALGPYAPALVSLVVVPLVGALLNWALWWDTPEHWDAFAAAHPTQALAVRALRAVFPHARKLLAAWRDAQTAKSQSGAADVAALALVVGLAALALVGCPHLPPVSGCAPTAQSCIEGRPHVCSASQRWEPAGDVVCRGACVVGDAGIAHCAPADGGAR